jgi:hypothetical protein
MGSHGRTGVSRLITGSVAEKIMRGSKCPVLILKAPAKQSERTAAVPIPQSPTLPVGEDIAT